MSKDQDIDFLVIPKFCIKHVIYGENISEGMKQKVNAIFAGIEPYQFKISRSNVNSYFLKKKETYVYDDLEEDGLRSEDSCCGDCFEPIDSDIYH